MASAKPKKRDIKSLLQKTTDAFVAFDKNLRYTYLSPEAVLLTGKPAKDLLGKKFIDVYPAQRNSPLYKNFRTVLRTRKKIMMEEFYAGLKIWFAIDIYPAPGGGLSAYFNDITFMKAAQTQLRETQEESQILVEHIKDYAIVLLDTKGRIRSWNPGAERIYGYKADEIIGKHVRIFCEPKDQKARVVETELEEASARGRTEREGWRVKKDGSRFWSNAIVRVLREGSGKATGYVKVTRDVTERKRSQEALEEQTRDLEFTKTIIEREKANDEALLNSIGDGVIATDADGNVVLINRQAQVMLGIAETSALGKHSSKLWRIENEQGEPVPDSERPLALVLKTGKKVLNSTSWYATHPYIRFPAATTTTPIIYNQKTIGAVTVFRNVAREQEIDRAKSEFVSLASHQLRTPLTAIKLFAEMLLRESLGPLTAEQKNVIQSINTSNDKMIHLVNDLLNVSRIESGRLKPKLEQVDLLRLIDEVVTEVHAVARARHCSVRLRAAANTELPAVTTDPSLLRQVITNLVTNALQYSPDGGTVTVTLQKKIDEYVMNVRDQGIGIPKSARPRIFERFFRTASAIKKKTEGTGLGLYMSKMIVELLGGKIWFRSQERRGTIFSISIPFEPRQLTALPNEK